MFVSIELENIGPYSNKVLFDFRINKKDKKNLDSTIALPDGTVISKIIGIIAGNASGKSTLINSLTSVGTFINRPVVVASISKKTTKYEDDSDASSDDLGVVSFQKYNPFISVNKSKQDNIGTIRLEMFINSDDEYEGFYQYTLQYGAKVGINGIMLEKLEFKKKYSHRYITIFQTQSGAKESEIGSKIAKKQNWIIELESAGMDTKSFEERLKYYETFYNRYLIESSIIHFNNFVDEKEIAEVVEKEKELFKRALKTVDNSIVDIESDNETLEKKVYICYDGYKLRYDLISVATKKVCDYIYNFIITSKKGGVLLSDEFDSSLNREIARMILSVYRDSNISRTGQFIFTAITPEIFDELRRDQIFVLTKENNNVNLTRFDAFKNPETNQLIRNDYSFVKAYKNNIIKNFPVSNYVTEFVRYMEERN